MRRDVGEVVLSLLRTGIAFDVPKLRAAMTKLDAKLGHFDEWQTALKDLVDEATTSAKTAGYQKPGGEDLEALLDQDGYDELLETL